MLQEVWWHYLLVYMLAVLYVYFCFQKMSSTVFYLLFFQISLYIYIYIYKILDRFDVMILKIDF
jgi:hypothetical protein